MLEYILMISGLFIFFFIIFYNTIATKLQLANQVEKRIPIINDEMKQLMEQLEKLVE